MAILVNYDAATTTPDKSMGFDHNAMNLVNIQYTVYSVSTLMFLDTIYLKN